MFYFCLRKSIQNWKTSVYRFSISYLVLVLQSFADAKIKAKRTEMKHAILLTSLTLNRVLGQKPPGQKPPGQKPPLPKTPRTKTPQTKYSFQKFYNFCF